jgi:CubicO group peptidase (beta-lactamase class C family)
MRGDKAQTIFDELSDFVREGMQRRNVPGVALGVVHDGRDFLAGLGVTNVDHPLPVDGDTLFQIGSTTKTFTATLAMIQADEGKLDLDAPVRQYLPDLKLADEEATAGLTVRHLLTHMGGWAGDFFLDTGWGDDALATYVTRMAELPQLTRLGERYSYNNAGFCLAGRVLEVTAGGTFEAAMRQRVFRPLGLARSSFFPAEVMLRRFAVGHAVADGKVSVASPWPIPRANNPAGGISSSAREQLSYARFHLGDGAGAAGSAVLSAAAMAEMQKPAVSAPLGREQGLAWMLRDLHGARLVFHGGATNGQQSAFLMVPDAGFAITVLTNSGTGARLHSETTKWALKRYLGLDDPDPRPIEASREELAALAGRYQGYMADLEIELGEDGLSMTSLPRDAVSRLSDAVPRPVAARIAASGPDRFVVLDGPSEGVEAELLRDGSGQIVWLQSGGRLYRRQPASE